MYTNCATKDDSVLAHALKLYNEADDEQKRGNTTRSEQLRQTANRHWVKARGEALAQGLVIRPGIVEENRPENPIRLFDLKSQIMAKIMSALDVTDPDLMLEGNPNDGKFGGNFSIKKTKSGDGRWPSYADSCFANKSSSLSEDHLGAICTHGLFDLASFLPTQPTAAEYEVLSEIVAQSVAGNRKWNPEWEAGLTNVKPYKEGTTSGGGIHPEAVAAVVEAKGTLTDSAAVVTALNKTGRPEGEDESRAYADILEGVRQGWLKPRRRPKR
jgi:hypothetical protein